MPRFLYRVFDNESVSRFHDENGFEAGNPQGKFSRHPYWAKYVVQRHMHWGNRRRTPFISVTASLAKANDYAEQRLARGYHDVSIAKIDTAIFRSHGGIHYHMATLVKRTHAHIDPRAWNYSEYLCLRHIPREAVIEVWDVEG